MMPSTTIVAPSVTRRFPPLSHTLTSDDGLVCQICFGRLWTQPQTVAAGQLSQEPPTVHHKTRESKSGGYSSTAEFNDTDQCQQLGYGVIVGKVCGNGHFGNRQVSIRQCRGGVSETSTTVLKTRRDAKDTANLVAREICFFQWCISPMQVTFNSESR